MTWKNMWVYDSNKDVKFDSLTGNILIENIRISYSRKRYMFIEDNKVFNKVVTINKCIFENAQGIVNGPGL